MTSQQQMAELQERALDLLREQEKTQGLVVLHVASDWIPSTKMQIFKFFVATAEAPNDPKYEIILDEQGKTVDVENLSKDDRANLFVRRDLVVNKQRLPLRPQADASITIKPSENILTLSPDETLEEIITVTIPKRSAALKVDVYLLADTTASMGPVLSNIQASADAILTGLSGTAGLDLAFGVGNYKDFPSANSPFQHQQSPTTDLTVVRGAINAWVASGGRDIPEGQLFALHEVAEDRDGTIGWRFDAKHVIVWFGDAPGHDPICQALTGLAFDITEGRVSGALSRGNITLIAISTSAGPGLNADPQAGANDYMTACGTPGGFPGQATRLTDATLGILLSDVEPTAIVTAILDSLAVAISTINDVHLDPGDEAGDFVDTITPNRHGPLDATLDQVVQFTVRFKGVKPCGEEAQTYTGEIAVIIDGNFKTFKRLTVTVPRCPRITEIEGEPSAAVARLNIGPQNTGQISVFARGSSDQLLRRFNNGNPEAVTNWVWEDWGRPSGTRVTQSPFAIASYQESVNPVNDFMHAFIKGSDGHLHEIVWDGATRSNWLDHDQPHWRSSLADSPTVIAFRRTFYEPPSLPPFEEGTYWYDSVDQLGAFVWGSDSMLYRHHQTWHGSGRPPGGADVGSIPGVAHRPLYYIYAFVVGNDRSLYSAHSMNLEASSWGWVNLGKPNANTGAFWFWRPGVVTYNHQNVTRLYTFVAGAEDIAGADAHLWLHVWRGREPRLQNPDNGQWHDQGTPHNASVASAASVVTCPCGGNENIYAFVRGSDNHLHVHFWDAASSTWNWRDIGAPPNVTIRRHPSAVVCQFPGADPLYVFIRGNDNHLYMCHMDCQINSPQWKDLSVEP